MLLFHCGLADVELPRLAVVVGKAFSPQPALFTLHRFCMAAMTQRRIGARPAFRPAVGFVICPTHRVVHGHVAVLLEMLERAARGVDRKMGEVRPAEPLDLGVEVGKVATLQQRVIGEVNAGHDVGGAKGHLFRLGKEIVHHPVQHQTAHDPDRAVFLGDQLGRVEHVEGKGIGESIVEHLQAQLPFREITGLNGIPQVTAVEIGIGAVDLDRLVPQDRLQPQLWLPMKFHKAGFSVGIDHSERVDAKAFHEPERPRQCAVRHLPHDHVHGLGHQRNEIPEIVMGRRGLRKATVRLVLDGVNQVGKLHRVLDEEHRDVVADDVPVATLGVKFHRKAAHVAHHVG